MSFVGSLFDSSKGAGYQAQGANLNQVYNQGQIDQSYQNTQQGLQQQQNFVNALQSQNGISNQSNVFNQQQALANQLQAQAQGQGPNLGAAQLASATQANTANQAALMASQRGTSANAGLIARQAAQQGAANQQNAATQAAYLRAQQQLSAQQQLQQQQAQMGGLATQQVGQQQNALNYYNQYANAEQQNLLNAAAQYNNAQVGMQSNINAANAGIAQSNLQGQYGLAGGLLNSAGFGVAKGAAHGGMIQSYAQGGSINPQPINTMVPLNNNQNNNQPKSFIGQNLNGYAQGGKIKDFRKGGDVPGKGKVSGDSYQNDTVDAKVSPGEIVIPRSITMGKNAPEKAAQFVDQTLKKEGSQKQHFDEGGMASDDSNNPSDNTPQSVSINPQFLNQMQNSNSNNDQSDNNAPSQMTVAQNENQINQKPINQGYQNLDLNSNENQNPSEGQSPLNQLPGREIFEKPVEEQAQALQKEASAKGIAGKQQAQAYGQNAEALQRIKDQFEQRKNYLQNKIDLATEDFNNGHINPTHYVDNMSTIGKVQTAIGLILSGIGSGISHQQNAAMGYLQSQIDRDIDAQKANLGKKETLLSSYFKEFGNERDAESMAKATQLSILASKIEKAGALSQDPIEKARAENAANQLRLQIAPQVAEAGVRQTLLSQNGQGQGNGSLDAFKARYLAPKGKEEQVEKDLKEFQDLRTAKANALKAFDEANAANTFSNRLTSPIQSSKDIESALAPVIAETAKFAVGKFTEADNKAITNTFDTKWANPETVAKQRRRLAAIYDNKMNYPSLQGVGINTSSTVAKKNFQAPVQYAKR